MSATPNRTPLTNAEHQARHRARKAARLQALEQVIAANHITVPVLRKNPGCLTSRNTYVRKQLEQRKAEEDLDETLTVLRQRGNQLVTDYVALLATPGLTATETRAIHARFIDWRQSFDASAKMSRQRPPPTTEKLKRGRAR